MIILLRVSLIVSIKTNYLGFEEFARGGQIIGIWRGWQDSNPRPLGS